MRKKFKDLNSYDYDEICHKNYISGKGRILQKWNEGEAYKESCKNCPLFINGTRECWTRVFKSPKDPIMESEIEV